MKAKEVVSLPKEFDFKSNINGVAKDILYHAKETGNYYEVSWDLGEHVAGCVYTKEQFLKYLRKGEFVVVE